MVRLNSHDCRFKISAFIQSSRCPFGKNFFNAVIMFNKQSIANDNLFEHHKKRRVYAPREILEGEREKNPLKKYGGACGL
jgi:hypothetical protein